MSTHHLLPQLPVNEKTGIRTYRAYGRRWALMVLFSFLCVVNNWQFIGFSPISAEMSHFYHVSEDLVSGLPMCFFIASLMSLAASWLCDKYDVGPLMLIAAASNMIGACIRFAAVPTTGYLAPDTRFWLIFAGQIVSGVCQPCLAVLPPRLAAVWFPEGERTVATAIAAVAPLAGIAVGFGLSPAIVTPNNRDLNLLITTQMICAVVTSVPFFFFYRLYGPVPPHPPSMAAAAEQTSAPHFRQSMKILASNFHFWCLLIVMGCGYGTVSAIYGSMGAIVQWPAGLNSTQAGYLGICSMSCGVLGAAILSLIVDATRRYREALFVGFFGYVAGLAVFTWQINKADSFVGQMGAMALLGLFSTSLLPVCLEAAVELTFPVPEGTSSGAMVLSGNVFGMVVLVAMDALSRCTGPNCVKDPTNPNQQSYYYSNVFAISLSAATVIPLFMLRSMKYKRLNFEHSS